MSHRCTNAFEYNGRIYPGGQQVDDNDPILATHSAHFAKVTSSSVTATETATAGPGELRSPQPAAADIEAWLAAEKQYENDVQEWLVAEELHAEQAAAAASTPEPPKTAPQPRGQRASRRNS